MMRSFCSIPRDDGGAEKRSHFALKLRTPDAVDVLHFVVRILPGRAKIHFGKTLPP